MIPGAILKEDGRHHLPQLDGPAEGALLREVIFCFKQSLFLWRYFFSSGNSLCGEFLLPSFTHPSNKALEV